MTIDTHLSGLMPLVIVAVVVGAVALPVWAFIPSGVIAVLIFAPIVLRSWSAGRELQLPDWLPGGRPGNR